MSLNTIFVGPSMQRREVLRRRIYELNAALIYPRDDQHLEDARREISEIVAEDPTTQEFVLRR